MPTMPLASVVAAAAAVVVGISAVCRLGFVAFYREAFARRRLPPFVLFLCSPRALSAPSRSHRWPLCPEEDRSCHESFLRFGLRSFVDKKAAAKRNMMEAKGFGLDPLRSRQAEEIIVACKGYSGSVGTAPVHL